MKVVSSIIRFSIGFEVKRGFRRQEAALSYSDIQRYSRIGSRQDLASALKVALAANFIQRLEPGHFDPNAGRTSKVAVYGLKWATDAKQCEGTGSKSVLVSHQVVASTSSESVPDDQSKSRTGRGSGTVPAERSKIRMGREIKQTNKTSKQQHQAAAVCIDAQDQGAHRRLVEVGFDQATAERLSCSRSLEHIERQIGWIGKRYPTRNALGMLRRAIEEDWPEPVKLAVDLTGEQSAAAVFARHFYAGLADNALTPVAAPSSADLAAADPLVKALLELRPDASQVEAWARQFGKQVAERQCPNQRPINLSYAVRLLGDAFVVWARRDRERDRRRIAASEREADEAQWKGEYRLYLLACETQLQEQDPGRYQEFLAYREERRKDLVRFAPSGAESILMPRLRD